MKQKQIKESRKLDKIVKKYEKPEISEQDKLIYSILMQYPQFKGRKNTKKQ